MDGPERTRPIGICRVHCLFHVAVQPYRMHGRCHTAALPASPSFWAVDSPVQPTSHISSPLHGHPRHDALLAAGCWHQHHASEPVNRIHVSAQGPTTIRVLPYPAVFYTTPTLVHMHGMGRQACHCPVPVAPTRCCLRRIA